MAINWRSTIFKRLLKSIFKYLGCRIVKENRDYPIIKPMDCHGVEILADSTFQSSCYDVSALTPLDTNRLATLWQLCRLSNPLGNIMEIGTYRGGGTSFVK